MKSSANHSLVPQPAPDCARPAANPDAICDECGASGAVAFDGITLCVRCYADKGSCCPEFGKDDLWADRPAAQGGVPPR